MKVELITEPDSDLKVVNAARCSFDKQSTWGVCLPNGDKQLKEQDIKLINYLAQHRHWTPFAHCHEVFHFQEWHYSDALYFLCHANLAGFEWITHDQSNTYVEMTIKGSLFTWLSNLRYLSTNVQETVVPILQLKYPVSYKALVKSKSHSGDDMDHVLVNHVSFDTLSQTYPHLVPETLRLTVPIFVKRQLETHRRNLVLTDMEDLSQNEVSRRYVESKPETYTPDKWRKQHHSKKQGSSNAVLTWVDAYRVSRNYEQHTYNAVLYYDDMNKTGIAHEQSRMILPLSTYTTFWWTGSRQAWYRVLDLRLQPDVQNETREVAKMIADCLQIEE